MKNVKRGNSRNQLVHEKDEDKLRLELEENLDADSISLWEHGFLNGYYYEDEWELI